MTIDADTTVIATVSPIPSHPSTDVLDATLGSVRAHLPDAETIIACDGVAGELTHRAADYAEHLRRVTYAANREGNVTPLLAAAHLHQAGTVAAALQLVTTPLVLVVEHDTPLADTPIDWDGIADVIRCGAVNHMRFSHEAMILPEHAYLMVDQAPRRVAGVPYVRTVQYSQRPALASTAFYRTMLAAWCTGPPTYIEDRMHGIVQHAWAAHGMAGWEQFRLGIYHPDDGSIMRSWHADGRGRDPKVAT